MTQPASNASHEASSPRIRYCDRCARRSPALRFDDLSLQELCDECWTFLVRRRGALTAGSQPKTA